MQATESQRHLAEYLLKANQAQLEAANADEPSKWLTSCANYWLIISSQLFTIYPCISGTDIIDIIEDHVTASSTESIIKIVS